MVKNLNPQETSMAGNAFLILKSTDPISLVVKQAYMHLHKELHYFSISSCDAFYQAFTNCCSRSPTFRGGPIWCPNIWCPPCILNWWQAGLVPTLAKVEQRQNGGNSEVMECEWITVIFCLIIIWGRRDKER